MTRNETLSHSAQPEMTFRDASIHDGDAIATLHAESWRQHYRGAYLDSFLDGDVLSDRLTAWRARMMAPSTNHFTIIANQGHTVVGFAHMILDQDLHWGSLLDNLHVTSRLKRQGIGRLLLQHAALKLTHLRPADSRFFLWVLAQNTPAQAFYIACGASRGETTLAGPFPGGGRALCHRFAWHDATTLLSTQASQYKQ